MSAKFLFEEAFDAPRANRPKAEKPVHTDSALAAARAEGFAEGHAAGLDEGRNEQIARLADTVGLIGQTMQELAATQHDALATMRREAVRLTLAIAARLAPVLVARAPLAELEALIAECLKDVGGEPRVVVRVAMPLVDELSARVEALKRSAAFAGEVIVLGEDDIAPGDCRVEWADGGAERDLGTLVRAIEERVNRAAALL